MDPEGARKSLGSTKCASSLKRQKGECPLVGPRTPNQNHTKTVTYLVERDKEIQEVRELNMAVALPGFGGGKLPGRKKAEDGKQGNDEEDEVRRVEEEVIHALLPANLVDSTTRCVLAGAVEEMGDVKDAQVASKTGARSTRESKLGLLADGERVWGEREMRPWEEVTNDEEKIVDKPHPRRYGPAMEGAGRRRAGGSFGEVQG